jgi:hypothetical protein
MSGFAPITGNILLICGVVVVIAAVVLLVIAAVQTFRTVFGSRGSDITGGGAAEWARLAEAIGKLPLWAIAMIAGDVQIWLGLKLLGMDVFK